jgi:hypothetical protein
MCGVTHFDYIYHFSLFKKKKKELKAFFWNKKVLCCAPISTNLVYIVVHRNYPKLKIIKKHYVFEGEKMIVRVRIFWLN